MEITKIMLGELASNCYVQPVGNGKCVVVDIGGDAPVLFRRLGMLGLEPAAILLTHGHYDHIAGVEQVREKYDIPVYVHTLDAHMLTVMPIWGTGSPHSRFSRCRRGKLSRTATRCNLVTVLLRCCIRRGILPEAFAGDPTMCCIPVIRCSACRGAERIFRTATMPRCWNRSGN